MSEQKNVSPDMVPADRTILCIELSCWRDEPMWKASDEEIYRVALGDVMQMGYGVTEDEVEDYHVTDIPTAYPSTGSISNATSSRCSRASTPYRIS